MVNEKIRTNLIISGNPEKFLEFRTMAEHLFNNRNHIATKYPDASRNVIDLKSELNTLDNLYYTRAILQDETSNNDQLTLQEIRSIQKKIKLKTETIQKVQNEISWLLEKIAVFLITYDNILYTETYSEYSRQMYAEKFRAELNNNVQLEKGGF